MYKRPGHVDTKPGNELLNAHEKAKLGKHHAEWGDKFTGDLKNGLPIQQI
jgi:hypothetical protein